MLRTLHVKNALVDPLTLPLIFNPKTVPLPSSFPTRSLNTLGSLVFELRSGQTDRQTDRLENWRGFLGQILILTYVKVR